MSDAIRLQTEAEFRHETTAPSEEGFERNLASVQAPGRHYMYYAATDTNGALVGVANTEQFIGNEGLYTQIWGLTVDAEHRGRGYGHVLLQHVAKVAFERGDVSLALDSSDDEFYQHFGFEHAHKDDPDDDTMFAVPAVVLSK